MNYNLFKHPELITDCNNSNIKLRIGIYIFGGIINENTIVNDLLFIKTGRTELKVENVKSVNDGPCGRYLHSSALDLNNY